MSFLQIYCIFVKVLLFYTPYHYYFSLMLRLKTAVLLHWHHSGVFDFGFFGVLWKYSMHLSWHLKITHKNLLSPNSTFKKLTALPLWFSVLHFCCNVFKIAEKLVKSFYSLNFENRNQILWVTVSILVLHYTKEKRILEIFLGVKFVSEGQ